MSIDVGVTRGTPGASSARNCINSIKIIVLFITKRAFIVKAKIIYRRKRLARAIAHLRFERPGDRPAVFLLENSRNSPLRVHHSTCIIPHQREQPKGLVG